MNLEELQRKYEKQKAKAEGGGGDFSDKFVSLKEGESVDLRILPWGEDVGDFFAETAIHYVNDNKIHCPRVIGEEGHKECSICEAYFDVWKDINALGKDNPEAKPLTELARGLRARSLYYFNVVDRRDGKVKVLAQGFKVYEKIMDAMFDEDYGGAEGIPVHDLQKGWDFRLSMVKKDGFNNYDKSKFRKDATPAGSDAEIARWLDEMHDLNELIKTPTYEQLKMVSEEIKETHRLLTAPPETAGMPPTGNGGMSDEEFEQSLKS